MKALCVNYSPNIHTEPSNKTSVFNVSIAIFLLQHLYVHVYDTTTTTNND